MPNDLDRLTIPDVLLPEQLITRAAALAEPERRLRLAVLENAIRHFQRNLHATDRRGRALYDEALDWFSDGDRDEPFSFENVCEALGLDPDCLRNGLQRWRDAQLAFSNVPHRRAA